MNVGSADPVIVETAAGQVAQPSLAALPRLAAVVSSLMNGARPSRSSPWLDVDAVALVRGTITLPVWAPMRPHSALDFRSSHGVRLGPAISSEMPMAVGRWKARLAS
jgi:hypothetical protein